MKTDNPLNIPNATYALQDSGHLVKTSMCSL